jgi:hypothetical protein
MVLDHERLDVYHLALDFLVLASHVIEALPRRRSHLADFVAPISGTGTGTCTTAAEFRDTP